MELRRRIEVLANSIEDIAEDYREVIERDDLSREMVNWYDGGRSMANQTVGCLKAILHETKEG